ncbi:MAG TPA: HAD-IA family hydrolase [Rhizomicrobium sp.]|jgi:phosphoglycolate phosphatase|nr:HAD-IA family hydrolase [Rhizomicrobium sp.]
MTALIFDLDGTLVDTAPDLLGALNAVLRAEGRHGLDTATLRHMVGFGARALIEQAMAATGTPVDEARLPALLDVFIDHYRAHIADESRPFAGVEATLAALQKSGMRLGVLTNKPQELTGPLLEQLNLARFFTAIHGAGRYDYVKPDPRVFHHVTDELGGGPAVMIGDSKTDVATARAAGAPVILLSYGYTPEPARTLGADLVLDDFADIPAALRKLLA